MSAFNDLPLVIAPASGNRLPDTPENKADFERLLALEVSAYAFLESAKTLPASNDEKVAKQDLLDQLPADVRMIFCAKSLSPIPHYLEKTPANEKVIEWLLKQGFDVSKFLIPKSEFPVGNNTEYALEDLRRQLPEKLRKYIRGKKPDDSEGGGGSTATKPPDDDDGGMGTAMGGPSMRPPDKDSGKGARSQPEPEPEEGIDRDM